MPHEQGTSTRFPQAQRQKQTQTPRWFHKDIEHQPGFLEPKEKHKYTNEQPEHAHLVSREGFEETYKVIIWCRWTLQLKRFREEYDDASSHCIVPPPPPHTTCCYHQ